VSDLERERDLVDLCRQAATAMSCYIEFISQRGGKNSGTTVGAPDGHVYVAGKCIPIEFKVAKGRLTTQQIANRQRREEHGVHTFVIRTLDEFVGVVNTARRSGKRA
jgi:hypothetical protein